MRPHCSINICNDLTGIPSGPLIVFANTYDERKLARIPQHEFEDEIGDCLKLF